MRTLDAVATQRNVSAASPLSAFRQLGTWAQVADILDVPTSSLFGRWIATQRTAVQAGSGGGYSTVDSCSEGSPNNWGAYCRSARAGIDAYLGDTADLAKVADLLRRWVGDTSVPNTFQPTPDDNTGWVVAGSGGNYLDRQGVINPVTSDGRSGANTSDAARGSVAPPLRGDGIHYTVGALDGALFTAAVLAHNGYPTVFAWGDEGLRRNARSISDSDWSSVTNSQQHVPFIVNHVYGVSVVPTRATGSVGRALGLGEWLAGPGSTWLR